MVSVGTIIWLSSELMFFAALFAAYFTIRSVSPELWAQDTELLNLPFATTNTAILVLSSVTCQMGVFAIERPAAKGGPRVLAQKFTIVRRASVWKLRRPDSRPVTSTRWYCP